MPGPANWSHLGTSSTPQAGMPQTSTPRSYQAVRADHVARRRGPTASPYGCLNASITCSGEGFIVENLQLLI